VRSEQFTAIIDLPVTVFIKGQETISGPNKGNLIRCTVGIDIKMKIPLTELNPISRKIYNKRVF